MKLTKKEIKEINELNIKIGEAQKQLCNLVVFEKNIKELVINLKNQEQDINLILQKKYGDVTIDLKNGNKTPMKIEPKIKK